MDMQKNLQKVYAKLSMIDQMMLNNYINQESDRIVKEIATEVDYCISATLIEAFPQLSTWEIREILDRALEYKEDQHIKVTAIRKEHGREIEKFVDTMGDKIIERANQLIKEKVNQNNALKLLKSEFKGIPSASIINYYKSAKEEYKGREEEIKVTIEEDKQNTKRVEGQGEVISVKKVENPVNEKCEVEVVEVITDVEKVKHPPVFRIKKMELEGLWDEYKVDDRKLIVRDKEYTSIEDIEDMYGSEINAIAKELEIARNRLFEAKQVFNEFIK